MESRRLGWRLGARQRPEATADRRESPGACRAVGDTALRGHKRLSKKWVGSEQGTDSTEGVVTSAAVLPRGDGMEDSRLDLAGERGGAKEQAGKPGKQEAGFRGCCRQRPRLEFRSEGGQRACLWGSGGFSEGCVEPADCQWGPQARRQRCTLAPACEAWSLAHASSLQVPEPPAPGSLP